MSLSPHEIDLVRQSFDTAQVKENYEHASRFYQLLFERDPGVKRLFRDDLAGQGMKFMSTLRTILAALDDPDAFQAEVQALGKGHKAMGVKQANFAPMGEALIAAFAERLGPAFTSETEAAWRNLYGEIAQAMIAKGGIE